MSSPAILLKRGKHSGDKPVSLQSGEIGINEFDGKLFHLDASKGDGSIVEVDLRSKEYVSSENYDGRILNESDRGTVFIAQFPAQEVISIGDIDSLDEGWTVDVYCQGAPRGPQTAKLTIAGQFKFRDASYDEFILFGRGEAFRLTKMGSYIQIDTLSQPQSKSVTRSQSGGDYAGGSAAWIDLIFNRASNENIVASRSGGFIVPVSGHYIFAAKTHISHQTPSIGRQASYIQARIGYDSSSKNVNLEHGDSETISIEISSYAKQGDSAYGEIFNLLYAFYYPPYSFAKLTFLGR